MAFIQGLLDVRRHHANAITYVTATRHAIAIYFGISGAVLFLLMLFATLLNYWGFRVINAYIFPLVVVIFVIAASWPDALVNAYLGNLVLKKIDDSAAVDNPAKKWAQVFTSGVFYLSIFYMFACTFPFRRNFSLVFILAIALIVLLFCGYKWNKSLKFGETFVTWYAVATALYCALGMLSPTVHYKIIRTDIFSIFHVRASDETLIEIEEVRSQNTEQARQAKLQKILQKEKNKQQLSEQEKKYLDDEIKNRDNGSMLDTLIIGPAKKIPGLFSGSEGNKQPAIITLYKGRHEIAVNPGADSRYYTFHSGFNRPTITSSDPQKRYTIILNDGSEIPGSSAILPAKSEWIFKIRAHVPQIMYFLVD